MSDARCGHCGLRALPRADGRCPSCGLPFDGTEPAPEEPTRPEDAVLTTVTLMPPKVEWKLEKNLGPDGVRLPPPEPEARLPKACPCCGAKKNLVDLEIPCRGRRYLEVSACSACERHLCPTRARPWVVLTFVLMFGFAIFGRAAWLGWFRVALGALFFACLAYTIILEWRERHVRFWPAPRDGHFGPMEVWSIGAWVFKTRNRAWLATLARGNPGFEVTTRVE